jgi:hypothetical protein
VSCSDLLPIYIPPSKRGIERADSREDGYTVDIQWRVAYPSLSTSTIVYNIYYSSNMNDVFAEGVKQVSVDGALKATLEDFTPGDTVYFAVRAAEIPVNEWDVTALPFGTGPLRVLPEGMLMADITADQVTLNVSDVISFPPKGIVQVGYELIRYTSKSATSLLGLTRGAVETDARIHHMDGYDGYDTLDPFVHFWKGFEDNNDIVLEETNVFDYPNYPFTEHDGYRVIDKDSLNTDLAASDVEQTGFITFDFSGWRRTDPLDLLNGKCVGTYFGGQAFCADGYGVGAQIRGIPFQDEVNRREEMLLGVVGEPCVLLKRLWKGITCKCKVAGQENPYLRCPQCYGVGFVGGYDQFFNPRRSDGRLLIRFDPTEDQVRTDEEGLESVFLPNCWSLVVPALHSRDILIRFNEDGVEEFRYEIQTVTRNKLLEGKSGAQKFATQRLRKTDTIYSWSAINSTASIPQILTTNIGFLRGPNGSKIPHTHTVTIPDSIVNLSQINQTTSFNENHNHRIVAGQIEVNEEDPQLGHTHAIIF